MAKSSEHRMVFDLRGRRKRVVQVVYAILALLMALSLLTVVGPFSIGDIFGTGGGGDATGALDEQAERIERQLARNPEDEDLLLALVRTRYSAGNTLVQVDPTTGQQAIPPEAAAQYEEAAEAWSRYLATDPAQPNANTAQQAANALFTLAQLSTTPAQATRNLAEAAEAQGIVAEARPSVGTLSTYAIYSYFAFDFEQGDKVAKQAVAEAPKSQRKAAEQQLATYRKRAKTFEKQLNAAAAVGGEGQAQQQLENPLGGLAGGGAGGSFTPAP
jgi:tetratricopeptide (TPR) repeat protein